MEVWFEGDGIPVLGSMREVKLAVLIQLVGRVVNATEIDHHSVY